MMKSTYSREAGSDLRELRRVSGYVERLHLHE